MPTIPVSIRVLAGLTILVAAACDAAGPTEGTTPGPSSPSDLIGTSWTLVGIGEAIAIESAGANLTFDPAGTVSGSTGCNSFSGTYAIDGTALTLGPLATTRMACEEPLMAQEAAVLEALTAVSGWEVDDFELLHLTGGTDLAFVLRKP
jgi:heat shock protein HslJ